MSADPRLAQLIEKAAQNIALHVYTYAMRKQDCSDLAQAAYDLGLAAGVEQEREKISVAIMKTAAEVEALAKHKSRETEHVALFAAKVLRELATTLQQAAAIRAAASEAPK